MRVIKFRGMTGNIMVDGNLIQGVYDGVPFTQIENSDNNEFRQWYVKPETVGEYAGVSDKDGNEIYEGTLFHNFGLSGVCQCVFHNGSFGYHVNDSNGKYASFISFASNSWYEWKDGKSEMIEVIGNIHQTPELLTKTL